MEIGKSSYRIHPLVATAAVAVTLASLTGIAAMTGMFPSSHSGSASNAPVVASAPATVEAPPVAAAPQESATQTVPVKPAPVKSAPVKPAPVKTHAAAPVAPTYTPPPVAQAPAICSNCGRVESVQAIQHAAQPSGLGIAAGAVVGGLLGNQVGGGNGRTLATVAGAVGGGYAGNEVEKRTRGSTSYEVRVRMENGSLRTFPQSGPNGWQVGDSVRVVNGALVSRG
ncbi:MAG TPA: glycine zipper 2TM domain-containing protein [Burkholderiaceae bacterium]|nr:glycine zipper 2TM domain-containing protein [Burkholderiaceae bacterium]